MVSAYREIRRLHPDYYVLRACGNDPNFFFDKRSNHCFLLISEHDVMSGRDCITSEKYCSNTETDGTEAIENIANKNLLLVDPSFNRIERFSSSGYRITKLTNQGVGIPMTSSCILRHPGSIPLGISSKGEIIYLQVNREFHPLIGLGFQNKHEEVIAWDLHSLELDEKADHDPIIQWFVTCFRTIKMIEEHVRLLPKEPKIIS
jgi:hypothetical protein